MTTITYRDGILASDGKESGGNCTYSLTAQKIFKNKDLVVGTAGDSGSEGPIRDLLKGRRAKVNYMDSLSKISKDFDGVLLAVFNETKDIIVFQSGGYYKVNDSFTAIGSGTPWAMAAMEMGASAKEAVKVACKYDTLSGGKVKVVKC